MVFQRDRPGIPRCAEWARDQAVAPAGTAPTSDVFVLIERPLPWPSDIAMDPELAELQGVAAAAAGSGRSVRMQAIAGERDAPSRRVVVFAAGRGPFRGFGRAEGIGAPSELSRLIESLVEKASAAPPSAAVTDVLVCTHGSRDMCCGSLGTRLWREVSERLDGVNLWRTSHTGGHRFAPTAITFPDGNYWAFLDADVLVDIVARRLRPALVANHLRGCAAFSAAVQVADGAVLVDRGWGWLDVARFGDERNDRRVELCFETPNGQRGTYDIALKELRRVPVPDCGTDPSASTKFQSEFQVTQLRLWD